MMIFMPYFLNSINCCRYCTYARLVIRCIYVLLTPICGLFTYDIVVCMYCIHFTDANVSNFKVSGTPGSAAAFNNAVYQAPSMISQSTKVQ